MIDVDWEQNRFGLFEDPHLLRVTPSELEVHDRAKRRSTETQERYLRRHCFIPTIHGDSGHETPAEFIATHLMHTLNPD